MSGGAESAKTGSTDYWSRTHRPWTCLVFLLPLLAVYEAGVFELGGGDSDSLRNGADHWMRGWLQMLGLDQPWLLPALIVAGLLVWHIASGESWSVRIETLIGMLAESLLFAFLLVVIGQLQDYAFREWGPGVRTAIGPGLLLSAGIAANRAAALAVLFVGAGIYEEVLFRLCLLPASAALFRCGGVQRGWAAGLAILATSLAFSLAHYVGPSGEAFHLFSFGFRTLAGLFFALLFVLRGFGITVGTHAAYDLIVGLLLASPG
jgi:membrane protease YdiL (CAAX protease family)